MVSTRVVCVRFLLSPLLAQQWTARGVMHALDFQPGGEPWRYAWGGSHQLRNPAGWVRHRLSVWFTDDGQPLADPIVSRSEVARQPRTLTAPVPPAPAMPVASEETKAFYLAQIRSGLSARARARDAEAAAGGTVGRDLAKPAGRTCL